MESFGRRALRAESAASLIEMEQVEDCSKNFADLDSLTGSLLVQSLNGERIVTMTQDELYLNSVEINGLTREQREFLNDTFSLDRQQSKGAWFFPERVNISGGVANLHWYFNACPRFHFNASAKEGGRVLLKSSPDAIFLWTVLKPLFEELAYPFQLRGELSGTLSEEESLAAWGKVDEFFSTLGFSVSPELALLRPGGGWHKLRSAREQLEAKRALLNALGREAKPSMGTRYRAYSSLPLVEQYYKKAKSDGRVKRKQVLTKAYQPLLSGFFEGDWLSLLNYLGEDPHPDEQIVTALPKTPLRIGGASRAAEIASKSGLPTEEVERIAAALWQQSSGQSPIEERVALLKKFWEIFDEIHARQMPGMKPLWGLVEEFGTVEFERGSASPHQPKLYLELLPAELIKDIERLWGTVMLTKWPDRMVTEPFPHQFIVDTFGPALSFWQSSALTAWFLCEGPYSRTDMTGLAHHQRRELAALKELNTPVNERLFEELIEAETRLGPGEQIEDDSNTTDVGYGVTVTVSLSTGTRRKGFEKLRDIITRHRRAWTEQYLDKYLRARWETDISDAARSFNLLLGEKGGKAPTLKQFARAATLPTNRWFGGDVSSLYAAIGEKSPAQPQRHAIMPEDIDTFVRAVFKQLPSIPFELYDGKIADESAQKSYLEELARLSVKYVQLEEAMGRSPEVKEIGEKFTYRCKAISSDVGEAWRIYSEAIKRAKSAKHLKGGKNISQSATTPEVQPQSFVEDRVIETSPKPKVKVDSPVITPVAKLPNPPEATRQKEGQVNTSEKKPSWLDRILGRR